MEYYDNKLKRKYAMGRLLSDSKLTYVSTVKERGISLLFHFLICSDKVSINSTYMQASLKKSTSMLRNVFI